MIDSLHGIREFMINGASTSPSFCRLAVPFRFSLNRAAASADFAISNDFLRIWSSEVSKYHSITQITKRKRGKEVFQSPFPYPRVPFALDQIDSKFSRNVLVPVGGLSTSYLTQFVACDILKNTNDPDHYPTVLLAEILSRTEGLLYTGIRGQGYYRLTRFAYGASITCYLWAGQLSFDLYRSSEPRLALMVFYKILEDLMTPEGIEKICSDYEIQTAQAAVAYRWSSSGATASSLVYNALRYSLQGFKDLKEYSVFIKELYKVTRADLQRVVKKYFSLFLSKDRLTVLTCPPGETPKKFQAEFKRTTKSTPTAHNLDFTVYKLKDFNL